MNVATATPCPHGRGLNGDCLDCARQYIDQLEQRNTALASSLSKAVEALEQIERHTFDKTTGEIASSALDEIRSLIGKGK